MLYLLFTDRYALKWKKLATTGCATANKPRTVRSAMERTRSHTLRQRLNKLLGDHWIIYIYMPLVCIENV